MQNNIHVDLCIIGAGAAGLSIASGAVQLGLDVALVEKEHMGGECLNTGCIPSKSIIAAAESFSKTHKENPFGFPTQKTTLDHRLITKHINEVIKRIQPHDSKERFEGLGVKVFEDSAHFIDKNKIQLNDETIISADKFVIAAGLKNFIPEIKNLDETKIHTHETIFSLQETPQHLCIIGGGAIAFELAQAFKNLGTKITILEKNTCLQNEDEEAAQILKEHFKESGITLYENCNITEIKHREEKHDIFFEIKDETAGALEKDISATHILIASGKKADLKSLKLENTNIEHDEKGILTDRRLRTKEKHIFAAGDIVAYAPKFTHSASAHAGIIIRNILFKIPAKRPKPEQEPAIPRCIYTSPECAQTGLTQKQALALYGEKNIITIKHSLNQNDRAKCEKQETGFIKLIARKNGKILGATIIAPHAGEMINLVTLAIDKKCKLSDLTKIIIPYPTYSEAIKHAAGAYYKNALFSTKTKLVSRLLRALPF